MEIRQGPGMGRIKKVTITHDNGNQIIANLKKLDVIKL